MTADLMLVWLALIAVGAFLGALVVRGFRRLQNDVEGL